MKKKEILNTIGFILIVATLLVILVFQKNIKVIVFAASFGLFVYGLMSLFKDEDNKGFITLSFAVSLAISGVIYFRMHDLLKAFTFMICCTVFLMMIISLIFAYMDRRRINKQYPIVMFAEVVDLIVNPNTEAKYYQPYYKYEIDGKEYNVAYPAFINKNVPNIGDKTKIRVEEKDKENIYFEKPVKEKIFDLASIIFFLIVSFVIMIGQFLWWKS